MAGEETAHGDAKRTNCGRERRGRASPDLAEAATERNCREFMLNIAPLPIPNGTASPVNPIAIF